MEQIRIFEYPFKPLATTKGKQNIYKGTKYPFASEICAILYFLTSWAHVHYSFIPSNLAILSLLSTYEAPMQVHQDNAGGDAKNLTNKQKWIWVRHAINKNVKYNIFFTF